MNTWSIIHFIVAIVSLIWCFLNLQVSFERRLYSYYIFTYRSHLMILNSAWKTSRFKYKISIYRLCLVFYLNVNFILSIFFSCRLKGNCHITISIQLIPFIGLEQNILKKYAMGLFLTDTSIILHCVCTVLCIWISKLIQKMEHSTSSWISQNDSLQKRCFSLW